MAALISFGLRALRAALGAADCVTQSTGRRLGWTREMARLAEQKGRDEVVWCGQSNAAAGHTTLVRLRTPGALQPLVACLVFGLLRVVLRAGR